MILEGKEEISKYLPQREPILMVDKLIDINDNGCEDALTVSANSIFVKDGALLDAALIEHTAQSGALFIGYQAVMNGEPVPLGLIGTIHKFKIERLPLVGEEMRTTITMEAKVGDVSLIGITVRVADEVIATGKMKVATPEAA